MPIWLMITITLLTIRAAVCRRCQEWNRPSQPTSVIVQQGKILQAIRDTPVVILPPAVESLTVILIPNAHFYYDSVYVGIVSCSRFKNDSLYLATNFYVASSADFTIGHDIADAFYDADSGSIVLGIAAVWDSKIIGHEILHMLLEDNHINSLYHPILWFDVMCKDKVTSPRRMVKGG